MSPWKIQDDVVSRATTMLKLHFTKVKFETWFNNHQDTHNPVDGVEFLLSQLIIEEMANQVNVYQEIF